MILPFKVYKWLYQWFSVHSQSCVTIPTINFRTFLFSQIETLFSLGITPFPSYSSAPFPLYPKQKLIYFLSLQIYLFWTFHINGIIFFMNDFLYLPCFQDSSMLYFILFLKLKNISLCILLIYTSIDGYLGCFPIFGNYE